MTWSYSRQAAQKEPSRGFTPVLRKLVKCVVRSFGYRNSCSCGQAHRDQIGLHLILTAMASNLPAMASNLIALKRIVRRMQASQNNVLLSWKPSE